MKTLFTILFSLTLLFSAKAQNKKETLQWLNQHQKYITMVNPSGNSSENFKVDMTDSYINAVSKINGKKYETKLYWSQIKKITVALIDGENGFVSLDISEEEQDFAPSITLYLSEYSVEMSRNLLLMANMSGTDVMYHNLSGR